MGVLVTCKNEEDPFKNESTWVVTTDLQLLVYADFYDAQGKLTPQSEVGSTLNSNSSKLLWLSLLPDPIKTEGARVVTTMLHYPSIFKMLKVN